MKLDKRVQHGAPCERFAPCRNSRGAHPPLPPDGQRNLRPNTDPAALERAHPHRAGRENSIELSWDAVTGAAATNCGPGPESDDWYQLDDGNLTGTTYTHSDVALGATYHYAIRAVAADGSSSAWSDFPSATLPATQSISRHQHHCNANVDTGGNTFTNTDANTDAGRIRARKADIRTRIL